MVSGSLALLYIPGFYGGSRAAAPIEDEALLNGEISPKSVCPPLWAIQPQAWLAGPTLFGNPP